MLGKWLNFSGRVSKCFLLFFAVPIPLVQLSVAEIQAVCKCFVLKSAPVRVLLESLLELQKLILCEAFPSLNLFKQFLSLRLFIIDWSPICTFERLLRLKHSNNISLTEAFSRKPGPFCLLKRRRCHKKGCSLPESAHKQPVVLIVSLFWGHRQCVRLRSFETQHISRFLVHLSDRKNSAR